MAIMEANFFSNSLKRTTTVNVIIPTDKRTFLGEKQTRKEFPVLYLLHGIFGCHADWLRGTTVAKLADKYNLCVVMPAGENKFYADSSRSGDKFGTFISEELPEFIRNTFPVSHRREDTFLAGLSMGGFGACVNGLRAPETFGYIGMFSAAVDKKGILNAPVNEADTPFCTRAMYETMFDLDDIRDFEGSPNDFEFLAKELKESGKPLPKIWMACGTEDFLIKPNNAYAKYLKELNYDVEYHTWKGIHDWVFWEECINRFIPWLPIEEGKEGISSGHVTSDE